MSLKKKICASLIVSLIFSFSSPMSFASTEKKVKVSTNDSTSGFLNGKLVEGTNISLVENNDGQNETLSITATGAAVALDLTDDDVNESTGIAEVAVTNDTNGVFSEPTDNKLLINASNDWPKADDADDVTCVGCVADAELATDFISEVELDSEAELETQLVGVSDVFTNNDGALNDDDVTLADVQSATTNDFHNIGGTDDDVPETGDLAIIDTEAEFESELFAVLTPSDTVDGDSVAFDDADSNFTSTNVDDALSELDDVDDAVNDGDGTVDWTNLESVPAGFADGTDDIGGSPAFSAITSATNTTAAMVVGTGASLATSGTGTITASGVEADSVALGTDTTGNYVSSATASQGLTLTGTEGASVGLQDCAANEILKRNAGDTAWECAADSTGGSPSFDTIATGTNTTATMTVGTGATINTSGSGTVVATTSAALAANGANCSAGNYPLGVDAAGAVETCTADDDVPEAADYSALTGGRSITNSPTGTIVADAELYTRIKDIILEDPTAADLAIVQVKMPSAFTVTRISCSTDVGTATIQFDERAEATPNTSGTDVMTSQLICDNNTEATTSFTNAGIAADVPMSLDVDAVASTPGVVRIHVDGTYDD